MNAFSVSIHWGSSQAFAKVLGISWFGLVVEKQAMDV